MNVAQTWAMLGVLTTMLAVIATLRVAYMRKGFDEMGARIDALDTRFTSRIDALQAVSDVRFTAIEERLDRVDTRLDRVETRLDRVETRLDSLDRDVQGLTMRVADLGGGEG